MSTRNLPRPEEPNEGDVLGPFSLHRLLGEGGMGRVFLASRAGENEPVALKLLKAKHAEDETARRRFARELRSAAQVEHPSLARIFDSGEIDGRPYVAVEYLPGLTLEQRVRTDGPLPPRAVVRLAEDVASALDALHEVGVVHRDLKAANILFRPDGTAVLTDFGLSRGRDYTVLTRQGQVIGTVEYIAPELVRGEQATPASDIYALGCVAFEAVQGQAPFGHKSIMQVAFAHLEERPPDPAAERTDAPTGFSEAILSALEKSPSARPASAGAYAARLAEAAGEAAR